MVTEPNKTKRQIGGELVIPVIAIGFTLYFFSSIWNSPWTAQVSAFAVGSVLLLVCAIFIIRCLMLLREGSASLGFSNLINQSDLTTGRLGLLITTVGYCVLIDHFGFTLTTFLFLALSMLVLSKGQRPLFITWVSACMALGGWAIFIWAFDTRFPRGWFEITMKAVLENG